MAWRIEVSADVVRDIDLLFHHLADSYVGFGETRSVADARALERIGEILGAADRIAVAPFRGEAHGDILPGLRHLTLDQAIYWYQTDETAETIRILAIFYGGQDHVRRMLRRLLSQRA
ncbi:type II toxin-antitoxin system RelE/ParE family toxin [Ruegeria sp. HKCCD8929]|uniref:type II toxin-antitoxin system RelE/ParE family toxin n=1 Tax=Ruegeria sp. HKCCD8929 TaxID=2683006 RepID=UPI0014894AB7|nr:type II toxin-antitoxin system RelE/ParE family toxin [Ruegeria sp. HKCCD8929]